MSQLIIMTISLLVFGLLLCLLKIFLCLLGRQESRKQRTRIIFSRNFKIKRPISIQIESQYNAGQGRARIFNRTNSASSTMYGTTERPAIVTDSTENVDVSCSICLGTYQEGQELFILDCGHVYHEGCILEWLEKDRVCPICRKNMSKSDLDFVVQTLPPSKSHYSKISYI